nr:PREDICTED: uncharacterized protein LOC103366189 [Stegastes partitus]
MKRRNLSGLTGLQNPGLELELMDRTNMIQLQVVVQEGKLDLIMNPVFLKLIEVKWKLYGRLGAWLLLLLNFLFNISWTTVAISVSVRRDSPDRYVLPQDWWRVLVVVLALLLTLEEVLRELRDIWQSRRKLRLWRRWAKRRLHDDLRCSHPMWPQVESKYSGLAEDDNGDEDQRDETDTTNKNQQLNKQLLDHFRHLAVTNQDTDQVDLQFLDEVISGGADPNSSDRFGQTVLHEISRAWSVDVMRFFLGRGSDLLRPDQFGVTALHVAAALDYQDMVQFLLDQKGADLEARTRLDQQTPLHYAAKNDAVGSIRLLLQAGAAISCTDYKLRTPLQLAANLGRSEAARLLLELGADAGMKDADGQLCITALIGQMSPMAQLALTQFTVTDRITRQQYFYLNLLEPEPQPEPPEDHLNVCDWLVYCLLTASFSVHLVDVLRPSARLHTISLRLFSITVIFLWLRLMKHVRAFRLMGPFIVMLGNIVDDVMRFLFLYAEIFIPYACSFWIIFGGQIPSMQSVSGLLYSLYRITLVDEYEYAAMVTVDDVMAPLLCGTFLAASSILCVNLLIALLSDTFQRIHDNSKANAVMQQAAVILQVEDSMPLLRYFYDDRFVSNRCSPLVAACDDDITTFPRYHDEMGRITMEIKDTLDRFLVLQRDAETLRGSGFHIGQELQNHQLENQELQNQELQNQKLQNQKLHNQELQDQEIQNQELGGKMAAAQTDRDPPSALCSEFLSFSAKDTASRWLAAGDLQQEVYRHLAVYWLLLGEEPATGLALLQENNQPSPLCGHVFKVGEPTYSCRYLTHTWTDANQVCVFRECAADPTCVLCMQCFLGSVHKEHRYRMTTSGGGGFCDCGDAEAWKNGPYCQKHTADGTRDREEDPVSLLPPDLVARSYSIFSIILKYAVDLLTWEQEDLLPAGLEPPYVHAVIYTLQKAVNCSQKEAVSFATTVDRDVKYLQ